MATTPSSIWRNPVHFLAFGFGSGAVPKAPGTAGTAEPDRIADESAIRDLFAQNAAAINQRNPAAAAATYTPDGDIWVANGPHVTGVAELREHFERVLRWVDD